TTWEDSHLGYMYIGSLLLKPWNDDHFQTRCHAGAHIRNSSRTNPRNQVDWDAGVGGVTAGANPRLSFWKVKLSKIFLLQLDHYIKSPLSHQI
ncbi:MAG: hypothetical protein SVR81_09265, partial [Chloroflexota bacterium]|nr:hypothetical protein [Chloroflexota bacterium]